MPANPPRVLDKVLSMAHAIQKAGAVIDSERLCFLVADDEWDALKEYQKRVRYSNGSDSPNGMVSMSILGIEIIKRSAVVRFYYEE